MAKALLGKDVLSDELPYVTGSIGLLGTRPSYELIVPPIPPHATFDQVKSTTEAVLKGDPMPGT